ncbi:MAG: hypothetical protein EPO21_19460 [Chloroflexota bacterium]|nr:MAG: hypothetical protein EPO21_19460 [Chloroflexota bacterium]
MQSPAGGWLSISSERGDDWLAEQLENLWEDRFQDTPRVNNVEIYFARPWKTRLGVISLIGNGHQTSIRINSLLCDSQVPDEICIVTVAHELVHYAHGFGSPLPRKFAHPHQGNVVSRELVLRGLSRELQYYRDWIADNWYPFYYSQMGHRRGRGHLRDVHRQPHARSAACHT